MKIKPWWCTCDSTGGYKGDHRPECYGEQPAFPRLMAALEERERRGEASPV